jgi:hypothetical protein
VLASVAVAMSVVTASASPAPSGVPQCGNATLKGTYTFAEDGWTVSGTGTVPFALAGVQTYDGAGGATGVVTTSVNGVITPATPNTATYHINRDCTGTVGYHDAAGMLHFDLYLAPSGDSFHFVQTDSGAVSSGVETRVSR